ncbi:MAG: alpha/beta hydrolase [Christensenellales bacterium]
MTVFLILLGVAVLCTALPSAAVFNLLIQRRGRTEAQCLQRMEEKGIRQSLQWFDAMPWQETSITTDDSVKLYAKYLDGGRSKAAIIVHGYRTNHFYGACYARIFYEEGYSVLVFDQRSHGRSPGRGITLGFKEKRDLDACVRYAVSQGNKEILLHGESMGTSTCIQFLADMGSNYNAYLRGAVLDCGFTSAREAVIRWYKQYFKLPLFPFFYIVNMLNRTINGYWFKDLDNVKSAGEINTPVFYIHGQKDDLLPASMSRRLFEATNSYKAIWEVPDAKHALSCHTEPEEYRRRIQLFIAVAQNGEEVISIRL